jgi:nucleotide-binding universal stress UspA family protein
VFKVIVLGLDGSEFAERGVPIAKELAQRDGARIEVVHVRELRAGRGGGYPVYPDEDELEANVRRRVDELNGSGIPSRLNLVTTGTHGPAHAIADVAEEVDADLIVVGTRGHAPVAGLLLGSVTQRLLHVAARPILAVPPGQANGAGRKPT